MTATKPLDVPLPLILKQEKEEKPNENDDSDDENEESDTDSISSLPQPSILDKNSLNDLDPDNEHLRLTSMVRRVYFSYLHRSILNNYKKCCTTKDISRMELKKFSSQMELNAVRASIETSLYRQAMLKMISDVKDNTTCEKIHQKLAIFLETQPTKVDVAVQTCEELFPVEIKSSGSPVEKQLLEVTKEEPKRNKGLEDRILEIFDPTMELQIKTDMMEYCQEQQTLAEEGTVKKEEIDDKPVNVNKQPTGGIVTEIKEETTNSMDTILNLPKEENDNSRDSLMKHLEDIFCESDDSSDLTALIEKCSGVTKSSVDKEIRNLNQEGSMFTPSETTPKSVSQLSDTSTIITEPKQVTTTTTSSAASSKRKLSYTNYKNKRRAMQETGEEIVEDKQTKKIRGIWFVERIHQVSKLKAKLTELSVKNYRKHGKIMNRFRDLFGEDDGEDLEPNSPIHIEEHLTWCKERIAPWVVDHLMPFYKNKNVISNRQLFKEVAKHITDMLIIDNTFPEEDYVKQYIKDYFRNKPSIKSQADIYI